MPRPRTSSVLAQLPLGRLDQRPQGAQLHRRVEERVREQVLGRGPLLDLDLREEIGIVTISEQIPFGSLLQCISVASNVCWELFLSAMRTSPGGFFH